MAQIVLEQVFKAVQNGLIDAATATKFVRVMHKDGCQVKECTCNPAVFVITNDGKVVYITKDGRLSDEP